MNDNALVKLDAARAALAECKTVMEVKQIADMAEAARVYLERTQASVETVNKATEIRLIAERQMGAFLKQTPRAKGGAHHHNPDSPKKGNTVSSGEKVMTIPQMGLTHPQAERAVKLAEIPAEEFHGRIEDAKTTGKLSTASVLKKPRRVNDKFNLTTWQRQAKSVMTSWLQSVPDNQLSAASSYLVTLPKQILEEIT